MSEEVNELLDKLGKLEDAPLIWINKKVYDTSKEIERLNNKIDKAIEFINDNSHSNIKMNFINKSEKIECKFNNNTDPRDLLDILQGSDKE